MTARVTCSASSAAGGQSSVGLLMRSETTPCKPDHTPYGSPKSGLLGTKRALSAE
jgi:NAD(P)-dependent dehydrogenase (short-subunit alcohol dehydrogenase family)